MELVKDIFFNTDKIIEGTKVKISYVGYLFQIGSEEVYLHYGFGMNWDNVSEVKMEKTELGFQCEIDILEGETLNLCYRNEENVWDNCFGQNFVFPIEEKDLEDIKDDEDAINDSETSLAVVPETGMEIRKGLRKSYILGKKIKLAFYKFVKLFSGSSKEQIDEN